MNLRILWRVFGNQRAWSPFIRMRPLRNIQPFVRHSSNFSKYPGATLLLSLTGVYSATHHAHNDCAVEDGYLQELTKEMVELEKLKNKTLICKICHQRLLVDKPIDGKVYCKCDKNVAQTDSGTGWQPFLESKDIIIWRREEKPNSGLHEYKVYGRYEEVTAEDFLAMHIDLVYWKSWDETALSIKKLPHVKTSKKKPNKNEEIIYWETLWPRFFANRDYVYVKRYAIMDADHKYSPSNLTKTHKDDDYGHKMEIHNQQNTEDVHNAIEIGNFMKSHLFQDRRRSAGKVIVLTSQSCEHPEAPETSRAHRVREYRSDLVIKPFTDVDKPGIEFSLTYFDDPGTSIPSALQSWVAGHACPEFLHKMRVAARDYKKFNKMSHVLDDLSDVGHVEEVSNTMPSPPNKSNQLISVDENAKIKNDIDLNNNKTLSYAEKTKKETEELLNLLCGGSKDKSPAANKMDSEKVAPQAEVKAGDGEVASPSESKCSESQVRKEDLSDKQKEVTPQGMSYWHVWPLYYFA